MPLIKHFSEIKKEDIGSVGGKNASLGEMFSKLSSKGIHVPDGFAVTSEGYWYFMNHNKLAPVLTQLLWQLDTKTFNNLPEVGLQARQLILKASFPDELKDEIIKASKN